jgi:hypothetical protein
MSYTPIDYEIFSQFCDPKLLEETGIAKLNAVLRWMEIVKAEKGYLVPPAIVEAWVEHKLYWLDENADKNAETAFFEGMNAQVIYGYEEAAEEGVIIIKELPEKVPECIAAKKVSLITNADLVRSQIMNLPYQMWRDYFKSIAVKVDPKDPDIFAITSFGYLIWLRWDANSFEIINPAFVPRNRYYIANVDNETTPENYFGFLMESHDLWGNMLVGLLKSGLTRKSFGYLLRQKGTNLATPIQMYGNKSTFNECIEYSKDGMLDINFKYHSTGGIGFEISNASSPQAVVELYRLLNYFGIVSFPQHQGDDIRSGLAALATGISLIEYKGMKLHLFERAVDKVTKIFNRCALVNRVGTSGEAQFDPDDM